MICINVFLFVYINKKKDQPRKLLLKRWKILEIIHIRKIIRGESRLARSLPCSHPSEWVSTTNWTRDLAHISASSSKSDNTRCTHVLITALQLKDMPITTKIVAQADGTHIALSRITRTLRILYDH